jgi:hypothetical protein
MNEMLRGPRMAACLATLSLLLAACVDAREAPVDAKSGPASPIGHQQAAVAAPGAAVGPEIALAPPSYRPRHDVDWIEGAAFDGRQWLVVWSSSSGDQLYATRVSADGTVLDRDALPLTDSFSSPDFAVDVASTGDGFRVVWSRRISDGVCHIFSARVSAAGTVLDPGGVPLIAGAACDSGPQLAFDGTQYLLVWTRATGTFTSSGVRGARLTPAGQLLDPDGFPIGDSTGSRRYSPGVAFDGTRFTVVWSAISGTGLSSTARIYAARVTPAGQVLDTAIPISGSGRYDVRPAIAAGAGRLLVTWTSSPEVRYESDHDVRAARLDTRGAVLDPGGFAVAAGPAQQEDSSAAFDGERFVVGWRSFPGEGQLRLAQVDPQDGLASGSERFIHTAIGSVPAFAGDADHLLVGWTSYEPSPLASIVRVTRIGRGLEILDPEYPALDLELSEQHDPVIARGGDGFLAVWADDRDGGHDRVYGLRLDASGQPRDPAPFPISAPGAADPSVAFDGSEWLVAWEQREPSGGYFDVRAARVALEGRVLDASSIAVSTIPGSHEYGPEVISPGGGFLVTWTDGSEPRKGVRIGTDGVVQDPAPVPLGALASDGHGYFMVSRSGQVGTRLDRELNILEPAPIALPFGWAYRDARVTFDGAAYVVTALQQASAADRAFVVRIDPAGHVLNDEPMLLLDVQAELRFQPSAAGEADGGVLFAWRSGSWNELSGDLRATRLSADGRALGGAQGFVVSAAEGEETHPSVASGPGGTMLVYQRSGPEDARSGRRVYARLIRPIPAGGSCELAAECASSFCVDGVCCASACGGGDPNDCQACAIAAGAASNGSCQPLSSGRICRPAAGACDAAEVCDGAALACPGDAPRPDGTACDDGNACTRVDRCETGACVGGDPLECVSAGACRRAGTCDPSTGTCSDPPAPDHSACDDGNGCTSGDACQGGVCVSGAAVECPAVDACHVGVCDEASGACAQVVVADGTACDDGDACTSEDACTAGTCAGRDAVECPAAGECRTSAACVPATGACASSPLPDGTACTGGVCQAGECIAVEPDAGPGHDAGSGSDASRPDAGPTPVHMGDGDGDGGCGCRVGGRSSGGRPAALLIVGVALTVVRRRRSRRGCTTRRAAL